MTPFGLKMRALREENGLTQKQQADYLGVSKAYISALETGSRGRPSGPFVDQICVWLGLIWDDAEALKMLASLSHPKPTINARKCGSDAVYLANLLSQNINRLDSSQCKEVIATIEKQLKLRKPSDLSA
jgi:transcriptional regulator with XRE-family HTH domain